MQLQKANTYIMTLSVQISLKKITAGLQKKHRKQVWILVLTLILCTTLCACVINQIRSAIAVDQSSNNCKQYTDDVIAHHQSNG